MAIKWMVLLGLLAGSLGVAAQTQLVEGLDARAPYLARPLPALNQPYADEAYGARVRRVSDAAIAYDRDPPSWVRHAYSRQPAFNADSSRVLMQSSNGWMRLFTRDAASGALSFSKTLSLAEPQEPVWHPSDPHKIRHLGYYGQGLRIHEYDIRTDQSTVLADLGARVRERFPRATSMWTKQEGRPSNDGRIWCLQVEDANFAIQGLIAYDLSADRLLGSLAVDERPDHISTSPLGQHCVPSWVGARGTRAYSTDFQSFRQLHSTSEHSDLALIASGAEVLVFTDYQSGDLAMVELANGQRTNLFRLYGANASATAVHVSGIGSEQRPGWALVSTYACSTQYGSAACPWDQQPLRDKLLLVQLAANPRIVNVAHNRWGPAGYFGEPQAVANKDYSLMLFASSWGAADPVHAFQVEFNATLLGSAPPSPGLQLSGAMVQRIDAQRAQLGLRSNQAAACRLSSQPGTSFSALSLAFTAGEGGLSHARLHGLGSAAAQTVYARCRAEASGAEQELALVIPAWSQPFTLGLLQIKRSSPYAAELLLSSSAAASCRLATQPGHAFGALWDAFSASQGGLRHSKRVGLSGPGTHQRWAVCRSGTGAEAELALTIR
ncbi:hypothetical protein [Inhella sp.]|uniref:hypothetical protein n=1 Tax=Inhella sp. TaxID=1921806 RepID=UPI0035B057E6